LFRKYKYIYEMDFIMPKAIFSVLYILKAWHPLRLQDNSEITASSVRTTNRFRLLAGLWLVMWLGVPEAYGQSVPAYTPNYEWTMGAVIDFLVQHRCFNGAVPSSCGPAHVVQFDDDPVFWRKRDWPGPWDGLVSDSVWQRSAPWHVISTFSTYPFRGFSPPNDGGDIYAVQLAAPPYMTTAVASKTRDGSRPTDTYFDGCGGTSWILFKNDLPVMSAFFGGAWSTVTAEIGQAQTSGGCEGGVSPAYTRYRLEVVHVPFMGLVNQTLEMPTIISEHYNNVAGQATTLERFFFGLNWGKYRWELWSSNPPARGDISGACPAVEWGYPTAVPALPNAQLSDCRMWTNIVPDDGSFRLSDYGWGWP
jgi:hypothetical protein